MQKDGRDEQIGTIAVADKNDHLNIVHIGYCTGSRWWHQGITSEAFSAIIPFLFGRVKANRIEAQFDPNNPNSGKVMVKCGLTYEGTLRQADLNNKGIVDAAMYSLLASLSIAPDNLFLLLSDCQYIPKRAKQAPDCEVISSVFSGLPPLWSHSIFGESLGEVLL